MTTTVFVANPANLSNYHIKLPGGGSTLKQSHHHHVIPERDSELSKHVLSDECIRAAALLEWQQFWHGTKHYAGSWLTAVCCIAITHFLYMEHNLLQTVCCREEAREHMQTNRFTKIKVDKLIYSPLFAWSWWNFLWDTNGRFGFAYKVRNPFNIKGDL